MVCGQLMTKNWVKTPEIIKTNNSNLKRNIVQCFKNLPYQLFLQKIIKWKPFRTPLMFWLTFGEKLGHIQRQRKVRNPIVTQKLMLKFNFQIEGLLRTLRTIVKVTQKIKTKGLPKGGVKSVKRRKEKNRKVS